MGTKLKKLKRLSAGPNSKKASSSKAADSQQKPKKPRGPKSYIDIPSTSNDHADADDDEEEQDNLQQAALDAEDMVVDDSDDDEEQQDEDAASKPRSSAANGKPTAPNFLLNLDRKGISRSRAEEQRLKKSERRAQKNDEEAALAEDDAADSDASTDMEGASEGSSEDEDDNFSGFDSEDFRSDLDDDEDVVSADDAQSSDEDGDRAERKYQERLLTRRKRQQAQDAQEAASAKRRKLPVRGDEGKWQEGSDAEGGDSDDPQSSSRKKATNRAIHSVTAADAPLSSDDEDQEEPQPVAEPASTITSGARFGMQAPYTIMTLQPRSARIAAARNQIARLATDIVGDPEVSLGLLRRLSVFAQHKVHRPDHDAMARSQNLPEAVQVDDAIRGAALMSLTAVYVDILPGYRIRALTEKEEQEKVNQETARRREWEQGLVEVYRQHLEVCEKVLRGA